MDDDIAARLADTPGTVYLVDHGHHVHSQHAKADAEIVLVPAPSDDSDDPLNWTPRRRWLVNSCLFVWVLPERRRGRERERLTRQIRIRHLHRELRHQLSHRTVFRSDRH